MASYFRRQLRPAVAPVEEARGTSHPETSTANQDERWAPSTSILIFPSPSTSIPHTPASSNGPLPHSPGSASMSNFSLPTSISVDGSLESASEKSATSSYRRIRLKRRENFVPPTGGTTAPSANAETRPQNVIPQRLEVDIESVSESTGDGSLEVELWEWSQTSSQGASPQREQPSPQSRLLRSLYTAHYPGGEAVEISWPPHFRERTISQITNTTNVSQLSYISHSTTPSSSQIPPTPLYFPFISLIKQLFGIDSETITLLGAFGHSSGAEADLFLSSPFDNIESNKNSVSTTTESIDRDSTHHPIIALLTQSTVESSPSTSAHSLKAGLSAATEYASGEASESTPSSFRTVLFSFPNGTPPNIPDLLLSPVRLTSSLASGAMNITTEMIGHSSSAVGTALSAVSKPVLSAVGNIGWGRSSTVPASA
ncbi:hypothetical protein M408DRAFT_99118 [Serendipita vermifera MAFF 305830]|uniref:Uncharacterized protein n=1 Tax=Serendipita vermifera MAFF 305830 TaxID=933852 RepID=A0A0C3BER1_SERVB|nr:hypothetical protein M408DRAFT_99118 [Serendipita vermifera MAFF 305830]